MELVNGHAFDQFADGFEVAVASSGELNVVDGFAFQVKFDEGRADAVGSVLIVLHYICSFLFHSLFAANLSAGLILSYPGRGGNLFSYRRGRRRRAGRDIRIQVPAGS